MRRGIVKRKRIRILLACVLAGALALGSAAPALGYVNISLFGSQARYLGVGTARLTFTQSVNVSRLGARTYRGRDTSYSYTVYKDGWGRRIPTGSLNAGKYPLEMYSRYKYGRVITFAFFCYTNAYATYKNGYRISVGTTESALKAAYGTALRKGSTGVYTPYTLNYRYTWRTTFYCKNGRVAKILISMPL
jgi:hypothetical protein